MEQNVQELKQYPISIAEVIRARSVVQGLLKPTQLQYYEGLSRLIGAKIYVKHENHNPTGSFKIRGGINLMFHLKHAGVKGVITFSTGNHGLSVATSAKWFGLEAVIVVPEQNNPAKNRMIREAGAELVEAGSSFEEASLKVEELCRERGLYYVHPADEPLLVNGVGTEFFEVVEDLPGAIDVVFVPIGAGSEAAAAITVLNALRPKAEVIAVQAESSPAAYNSWKSQTMCSAGNTTFAGGFATGKAYETTFQIYRDGLSDFVLLSEDEISQSIAMACYYTHNLVEGAGGSAMMAAYKIRERLQGKTVVLQMSGCNASPDEIEKAVNWPVFREGLKK